MLSDFNLAPMDKYNQQLLDNVHPAAWHNPQPAPLYDLVVVGAGTAGLICAIAAVTLGAKVALIEQHLMGGDCLNVGCVPSKSLIRSARLAAEMKNAAALGLTPTTVSADDFPQVMERVRRIRANISKNDSATRYQQLGVDVFLGEGVFTSGGTLTVAGASLRFKKAVIATGARAVMPQIPGLNEVGFVTNETVFNLTQLPARLVVIGGGPIGCELAQAFNRLGSQVTIIQNSRFLPNEDPEASALLAEVFQREGIEVLLDAHPLAVGLDAQGNKELFIEQQGKRFSVSGAEILIGAGRAPNVAGLGLECANVEFAERSGIVVDDFLRTSNNKIFAAGDCCMAWKFTHAADAAAQIVIQNALFMGRKRLSALNMPWCTYTTPEIAHVGLYQHEAESRNVAVESFKFAMPGNDRAQTDGEERGFVKVLVKKGGWGRGKILGATIVATHAGEMISEVTTAMQAGLSLGKLGAIIHPYPTQAEAIKRVAGEYNKQRLTPWIAKLLRWWLRLQK